MKDLNRTMKDLNIIFATRNKHKLQEMEYLLNFEDDDIPNEFRIKLFSLDDIKYQHDIEETGTDFFANAKIKATALRDFSNMICLSDDSGLCVPYLNDRPGVYSARYAGTGATDQDNIDRVLKELDGATKEDRAAKFVCVLCLAFPGDNHFYTMGECDGFILEECKGENGFGYDPVFYFPSMGRTFGQLTAEEKNRFSHRSRAVKKLKSRLSYYIK